MNNIYSNLIKELVFHGLLWKHRKSRHIKEQNICLVDPFWKRKDGHRERQLLKTCGAMILQETEPPQSDSVERPLVVILMKTGYSGIYIHFSTRGMIPSEMAFVDLIPLSFSLHQSTYSSFRFISLHQLYFPSFDHNVSKIKHWEEFVDIYRQWHG